MFWGELGMGLSEECLPSWVWPWVLLLKACHQSTWEDEAASKRAHEWPGIQSATAVTWLFAGTGEALRFAPSTP